MKLHVTGLLCFILLLAACTSTGIFGPQSPHKQYAEKLKKAGLDRSALGRKWLNAADRCFSDSIRVSIPYRETGFFAAEIPQATCVRFKPKRGQKITVTIDTRPSGVLFFAELWSAPSGNREPKLLEVADSNLSIVYEQEKDQELILRLQSELLVSVSYSFTIVAAPSLAFPVPGNDGTKVGSFWGDARDGGKRSHEGIDIFDRFRTPVVAACDGMVTRVNENRLGGKTVWLNPSGKSYMLYYAHLDSQIAKPLQQVRTGDTLGLMGNTGNARHTPTHLHFGIYANGAINPLPFVQQVDQTPVPVKGDTALLNTRARTTTTENLLQSPAKKAIAVKVLPQHSFFTIDAASGTYYRVSLPDGTSGFIPIQNVNRAAQQFKSVNTMKEMPLLAEADSTTAIVATIQAGTTLPAYAVFNDYLYVKYKDRYGWIDNDALYLKQ